MALEFWGDLPLTCIDMEMVRALFAFIYLLPRDHGRKHGRNRFTEARRATENPPVPPRPPKAMEIARADAHDDAVTESIRARDGLSVSEKRRLLAEQLVPRVTELTLTHHLNRFHAILRFARDYLGWKGAVHFLSNDAMLRHVRTGEHDDLHVRVTMPKRRLPWTRERLGALLTSPLYQVCEAIHRRWKPGGVIVRDAMYWKRGSPEHHDAARQHSP